MHGPYEREVQYYETDRMQIVHHSNYARWFEEARLKYLADIGVPYSEIERMGVMIPVLSVEAEFRLPFRFGDVFQVYIKCERFNGIKCDFRYEVYNKSTGELSTKGRSSHCFVLNNMKPFHMKKEMPELFTKFLAEGSDAWDDEIHNK